MMGPELHEDENGNPLGVTDTGIYGRIGGHLAIDLAASCREPESHPAMFDHAIEQAGGIDGPQARLMLMAACQILSTEVVSFASTVVEGLGGDLPGAFRDIARGVPTDRIVADLVAQIAKAQTPNN